MKIIVTSFIAINILFTSCKHGEQEIIILPSNYAGYALIVFNQKNGVKREYFEGKRVYRVPPNGILKTEFSGNYGDIGIPTFYYNRIESISQIPYEINLRDSVSNRVFASGGSTGVANEGVKKIEFQVYYAGTRKQMDKAYIDVERLIVEKLGSVAK